LILGTLMELLNQDSSSDAYEPAGVLMLSTWQGVVAIVFQFLICLFTLCFAMFNVHCFLYKKNKYTNGYQCSFYVFTILTELFRILFLILCVVYYNTTKVFSCTLWSFLEDFPIYTYILCVLG